VSSNESVSRRRLRNKNEHCSHQHTSAAVLLSYTKEVNNSRDVDYSLQRVRVRTN